MINTPARLTLYCRIRPLCGVGDEGDKIANAVLSLFSVVERRDQDIDITAFGAARSELLRQTWLVAALPDGPVERVEGEELGLLESFGRRTPGQRF